MIPVMLGVTALVFVLLRLAPGDAARIRLEDIGIDPSPEALAQMRGELGLDQPVAAQYIRWLGGVLRLDFGNSITTGQPVISEFLSHFRWTWQLALPALLVIIAIALPAGVLSAMHQGRALDNASRVASMLVLSIPGFCLGLMLVMLFSVGLGWLPSFGAGTAAHMVLPCLTLALGSAASYTRLVRAALLEELSREYIRAARARGVKPWRLVCRHALPNAALPLITSLGMNLALMLGGSAVVERVFSWPGVGKLLIDAVLKRDYNVVQGCVLMFAFFFVLVNLLADLLCMALDPKARRQKPQKGRGAA